MKADALLQAISSEVAKRAGALEQSDLRVITIVLHLKETGTVRAIDFRVDTKTELLR